MCVFIHTLASDSPGHIFRNVLVVAMGRCTYSLVTLSIARFTYIRLMPFCIPANSVWKCIFLQPYQSTVQLLSFHQAEWNNLSIVVVCIYLIMSEAQQLFNIPLLVNWSGLLSTFFGISGLLIFWTSVKWPFICEIHWHLFFDIYIFLPCKILVIFLFGGH